MATDMLTSLANSFGGPVLEDLGARLGVPASVVKSASPMIIGLVLAGVRRLAAQPGGVEKLSVMLQNSSQRMGARDLDTFVKEADPANSTQALDALTGSNSIDQVTANLSRKSGLDPQAAGKMLAIIAPAVLSQIAGMAKQQGMDAQGVVDAINANSDALGSLGNLDYILDDVPGISDDIKRGFDKLFGRSG